MPQDKTGDFENWLKGQNAGPKTTVPKTTAPKQTGGDFENWLRGQKHLQGAKPAPRNSGGALRPTPTPTPGGPTDPFNASLEDQARRNIEMRQIERQRKQAEFAAKPLLNQWGERAYDALARAGQTLAGQVSFGSLPHLGNLISGEYQRPASPEFEQWKQERAKELRENAENRPPSLAAEIGEGIIEAAPQVGLMALTGGESALGQALLGGGMAATSIPREQWRQSPGRALTQTAIGAAAPIIGGKVGQKVGGVVARRLAAPVAQRVAQAGGELLGGGAGNVIGTGAEQLAFEGKLNPRELTKSGLVGAALSAPGAAAAARRPLSAAAPKIPQSRTPEGAIITPESSIRGRRLLPPAGGEEISPIGPPPSRAVREVVTQPDPRFVLRDQPVQPTPRNARGAIVAQPSTQELTPETFGYVPNRKLLPPGNPEEVPTARLTPPTQPIIYPNVPETQEMPAIRERIAAENAPTRELPRVTAPTRITTPEAPPRKPTERQPVPKATDENINQLRQRQEELGRLAYDRRGDFTGDLRDEYNQITAHIRDYEQVRAPREIGPPPGQRLERNITPPVEERAARRAALQPGPEPGAVGRPVTQEVQIPGLKAAETFSSPEDARQGYFERFSDDELVDEIRRMEDVRNQATRGRSKLTPAQLKANNFDLKVAIDQQKERGRLQRQIGIEPAQRIAPRTPGRPPRKIQHSALGEVTEVADQAGVPKGKLKVTDTEGGEHTIQNPRTRGNTQAAFVRSIPAEAMPELQAPGAPKSPLEGKTVKAGSRVNYAIPAEAMPELQGGRKLPDILTGMKNLMRSPSSPVEIIKLREQFPGMSKADFDKEMTRLNEQGRIALHRHDHPASLSEAERSNLIKIKNDYFSAATIRERPGQVMGGIFGGLQPLFKGAKLPSRAEAAETAGGVQTVAQLGNPRFVIRNVLQHVAFGKQERTATRLAAAIDWAYSKASGKPRQIAAPRGSDLASYVRNWGKAIQAYKTGQPLPGGSTAIAPTANANKIDRAIQKTMTWINEIPDAANWQTRFEDSLQSIVRKNPSANTSDVIEQATMEANRASLRDKNFASSAMEKIKEGINKFTSPIFGTDKFGAGDFILKYTQVPGALLKRGIERSPLGLFEVAKQAATPGPYRRRNTLLALSRVAEGAATGVGLGAGLAAAGVLVGPEDESKTGRGFEREQGLKGYSLNASALGRMLTGDFSGEMKEGDTLYSIDWLQPWAMNLSAGAAMWNLHKDGKLGPGSAAKGTGEAVYNSLSKTLDVMGDQSVLKNLSRYLDKGSGETFSEKVFNFTKAVGLDVPSSFVPSLARQTRQVIDPYERDTRPEQRGGVAGFAKEAVGRALQQIPGVSSSFPARPSLLTGENRKTALGEMGVPARIAAQFSPANISTYTPQPVAREIARLNRAGEKVAVSFPAPVTNKRTGEREPTSSLRSRERRFAETWSRMSRDLIADPFYKDADNETKATAFAGLKRHLSGLGKEDFEEKSVDEIIESAMETVEKRREKEEK